jgi:hypothetical protein
MRKIPILLLMLSSFFPSSQRTSIPGSANKTCQRFVPIGPPEPDRMGIPWHGYFALDTETGQLCRTADWQLQDAWRTLPTCLSLAAK